jgi:hydrophobic/amphiphilic exporter-1 (mainly G- bacteria), HAE1 family
MNGTAALRGWRRSLFLFASLLVASTFALLSAPASGQENNARLLTLDEALGIAAERNLDIQKAYEYRNLVEGRYVQERAAALPQLTLFGNGVNSNDDSQEALGPRVPSKRNTRAAEAGLSQALFTWGQVSAGIRAAKVGIATADDQLQIFRQAAFRDVSASFYDILLARELNKIALQNLDQKIRHADEAGKKYSAGVATDYDVLVSKVDIDNARPAVIRTENLINIARERLRFFLAMGGQEVDAQGTLETELLPYPTFEQLLVVAFKLRPEISDVRHRVQIAEEVVTIAKAGDKPRLDFKGGYGWRDLDVGSGQQASGAAWSAGLFITYPIFDGLRTSGQVSQARSHVSTLKIEEAKLLDGIRLEVRDACNATRQAGEIIRALSGTVAQAERLVTMAEKGYEYGVKTRLDVDDAQLNLIQARGNLASARRDYLLSLVNLEYVTGRLGQKEVKK